MLLSELKAKLMKNPKFRKEYERYDLPFEIGLLILQMRLNSGLTQIQLAKKIGTKQPSLARAERGSMLPSLGYLQKIAEATGHELRVDIKKVGHGYLKSPPSTK